MRAWISLAVGLIALAGVSAALWVRTAPVERPPMADPTANATHSDLRVHTDGGDLALSDLRGKLVLVYFGYTSCPDICPTTLATLGGAVNLLPIDEQPLVAGVFVSVDPERDAVERLGPYARYFHPSFHGGTLPPAEVAKIAADWGVVYRKVADSSSAMAYSVDHSTDAFLVGADGRFVGPIAHGTSATELAARLRAQLQSDGLQSGSQPK